MTHTHPAQRIIQADRAVIRGIILNISELAAWNPALNWTDTEANVAEVGVSYSVSTRLPGRATLTYLRSDEDQVVWRLETLGGTETGEWSLKPAQGFTRVVHTMTHEGPLFALMQHATSQVPSWRLGRLQERAETRAIHGGR